MYPSFAGWLSPRAIDPEYLNAYLVRKDEAWNLYRRGGVGHIALPWVRSQAGELGRWILEIGHEGYNPELEGATLIRLLSAGSLYGLQPGRLSWIQARDPAGPAVFYRLGDTLPSWEVADLHPEWDTLVPPGGHVHNAARPTEEDWDLHLHCLRERLATHQVGEDHLLE